MNTAYGGSNSGNTPANIANNFKLKINTLEKYFETIQELLDRGFNVICFDWRGQGLSDRMIIDTSKQYIEDFKIHCDEILTSVSTH